MRGSFNFVAQAESGIEGKDVYTRDPEQVQPTKDFSKLDQNTCDVCGACAHEVLFVFRCYPRREAGETWLGVFHPFICYIMQKCGRSTSTLQKMWIATSALQEIMMDTSTLQEVGMATSTLQEYDRIEYRIE